MKGTDMLWELHEGDSIVARDGRGVEVRGRVDLAAPELGVLWVWEFGTGERRLLHAAECDLHPMAA